MIAVRRPSLPLAASLLFTILAGTFLALVAEAVLQTLPVLVQSAGHLDGTGVEPIGGWIGIAFALLFVVVATALLSLVILSARAAIDAGRRASNLRHQAVFGVFASALGILDSPALLLPVGLGLILVAVLGAARNLPGRV